MMPGGSPTASPLASRSVCGYFAHRPSHTGVLAREMALPGPGRRRRPSRPGSPGPRGAAAPRSASPRRSPLPRIRTMRANDSTLRLAPAHQHPVDVGLGHQLVDVVGPHAAAVEDAHRLGGRLAGAVGQLPADEGARPPGPSRAWPSCRCRWPRWARRRWPPCAASSGCSSTSPGASCRASTSSVSPASRSASVSPTHMMGSRPWSSAAWTFFCTLSSVSPKSWRRSEWPMMTCGHPQVDEHGRGDLPGERALVLPEHVLGGDLDAGATRPRARPRPAR